MEDFACIVSISLKEYFNPPLSMKTDVSDVIQSVIFLEAPFCALKINNFTKFCFLIMLLVMDIFCIFVKLLFHTSHNVIMS